MIKDAFKIFLNFKQKKYTEEQKGLMYVSAGTVLQALTQIIIISVLSRLLSAGDFGIIAIIQSLATFSMIFSQFGVSQVIIQKKEINNIDIKHATTISVVLGTLIAVIVYYCTPLIAHFFNSSDLGNVIRIFAPFFILKSLFVVNESLLLRNLQFKKYATIQFISYGIGYGTVSVCLAGMGWGYWSIIGGLYAQMLISGILQSRVYPIVITTKINRNIVSNQLFAGGGFTAATLLNYCTEEIDNWFIGKKLGIASLGVYNRAFSLYSLSARFFGIVYDKLYFPLLSRNQDNKQGLQQHFTRNLFLSNLVLTPISLLLFINAELIVNILVGSKWGEVIMPFKILSLSLPFRFGLKISKNMTKALGLLYQSLLLYVIFILILSITLYAFLQYGLIGAAGAVLISNLINYFQFNNFVSRRLGITFREQLIFLIPFALLNIPILPYLILDNHFDLNWVNNISYSLGYLVYTIAIGKKMLRKSYL